MTPRSSLSPPSRLCRWPAGWAARPNNWPRVPGSGIGGFLNATFGNAAELIIGLVALSKGLTGVVKASITGSIIGNLLLVLGASILAGGIRYPKQTFNQTAARVSATSLGLAAIALDHSDHLSHRAATAAPGGWLVAGGGAAFARHRGRAVCDVFLSRSFSIS